MQVPYPYTAAYSEVPALLSEDEPTSYTCIENISPTFQGGDNVEFTFRYKEAWLSYGPAALRPETDEDGYLTATITETLSSNGGASGFLDNRSNSRFSIENNTVKITRASYSSGGGPGGQYRFEGLIPISLTVNGKKYLLSAKD